MTAGVPLAYFITFTTYGSRLHGDPRGTVSRTANVYGEETVSPLPARMSIEQARLLNEPPRLNQAARACVRTAIEEVCRHNGWRLWTINVRTNHVHLVVSAQRKPEFVMRSVKAWATRSLIEAAQFERNTKVWTRHGSTRYLWDEAAAELACGYVRDGQGFELLGSVRPISE